MEVWWQGYSPYLLWGLFLHPVHTLSATTSQHTGRLDFNQASLHIMNEELMEGLDTLWIVVLVLLVVVSVQASLAHFVHHKVYFQTRITGKPELPERKLLHVSVNKIKKRERKDLSVLLLLFAIVPQLKPWGPPKLGWEMVRVTIFPHLYRLSYIQMQCYLPLWQLQSNFGHFSDGVCQVLKVTVAKTNLPMGLLTQKIILL